MVKLSKQDIRRNRYEVLWGLGVNVISFGGFLAYTSWEFGPKPSDDVDVQALVLLVLVFLVLTGVMGLCFQDRYRFFSRGAFIGMVAQLGGYAVYGVWLAMICRR